MAIKNEVYIKELRKRIKNSGGSIKNFAMYVMPSLRREQTIHRWLSGGTIPESVKNWLDTPPGNSDD